MSTLCVIVLRSWIAETLVLHQHWLVYKHHHTRSKVYISNCDRYFIHEELLLQPLILVHTLFSGASTSTFTTKSYKHLSLCVISNFFFQPHAGTRWHQRMGLGHWLYVMPHWWTRESIHVRLSHGCTAAPWSCLVPHSLSMMVRITLLFSHVIPAV